MRQVATALTVIACLALCSVDAGRAQSPNTVTVGFRNNSDFSVIVQGYTIVNGVMRRGQTVQISKKGMAFDSNVPSGQRYYSIYDATQTQRILLKDYRVSVQGRDLSYSIVSSPTDAHRVMLMPVEPPGSER